MSRRRLQSHGFTLVEALIAITILGFIGALSYGVFARAVESREKAEQITGRYHEIRQGMQRMATELSMAFITFHKDCDDPRNESIFTGKRHGNGTRLDFGSFSHYKFRADANESDQNELSYFVDRDPDDPQQNSLMRREQANIDAEPAEGGVEQVLIHDVKELKLEFYDGKNDRWEDEWDAASMDQNNRLPMYVSIKIVAPGPDGKDETFVTKSHVYLRQRLLITGSGFTPCLD